MNEAKKEGLMEDPKTVDAAGRRLPEEGCPTCGYGMAAATCLTDGKARPRPGDATLCARCGEILEFDGGLRPRVPSLAAMLQWPQETNRVLERAQELIRRKRPIK